MAVFAAPTDDAIQRSRRALGRGMWPYAHAPEPYALERITCPVLAISAEDDWFGTANHAKYIAANVPDGRAVIYPTGGHVLVGNYANVLRQITSFFAAR